MKSLPKKIEKQAQKVISSDRAKMLSDRGRESRRTKTLARLMKKEAGY